jgi:predicted nucleic acid-binding protein
VEGCKVNREVPPRYVVDASIVVKWYSKSGEEDVEKADKLINEHIKGECLLVSSPLVLYELSNTLRFNPNLNQEDVVKAIKGFLGLEIELLGFEEIFEEMLEIAFQKDITAYDAVYVALSRRHQIPLVTADYELFEKLKGLPLVISLKEMPNRGRRS